MAQAILLDSDVLIDYLRGLPAARTFVDARADRLFLSALCVAEVYAGVKDDRDREALDELISHFPVVPVTTAIAKVGGLFKRDYAKSHGVGLVDSIMAATAQAENAELATLNVKHYPMLKGLSPAYSKK